MPVPPDRFDEIRRKWIARYQRTFIFQKRRAEVLARQIRDRAAITSGARVDPADDDVIHPFFMRSHQTKYGAVDAIIVCTAAAVAPIGWPLGRLAYKLTVQQTDDEKILRSYPIAAFMWAAVVIGLPMALLYSPTDSLLGTLLAPYLFAQIPATALAAGVYGILEGWLAVDGSRDWWPMRPPPTRDDVDFGWARDDLSLPAVFQTQPTPEPGERTPIHRDRLR